jgi:hypothetical protein
LTVKHRDETDHAAGHLVPLDAGDGEHAYVSTLTISFFNDSTSLDLGDHVSFWRSKVCNNGREKTYMIIPRLDSLLITSISGESIIRSGSALSTNNLTDITSVIVPI